VLVYLPQNRQIKGLRGRMAEQRVRLAENAQKSSGVPEMARQVEEMKTRYRNFDRRLPKQKELGEFLREISSNLSEEELSNRLIKPGSPVREEVFHTLPIILRFRGSYLALASFLKRIDEMARLTQIQKLCIVNDGKSGSSGEDLSIEVHMNIYFTES